MRKLYLSILITIIAFTSLSLYFIYNQAFSYAEAYKSFYKLRDKVAALGKSFSGDYSYVIKDMQKPFCEIKRGENVKFPAASVIKIPIAAVAFQAIKENRISPSQKFTISAKDITGGSGIIKTMHTPVVLTFQDIIKIMITNSDNTATNKLISILGYRYINANFKKFGLKKTILRRKMMDFSKRRRGVENYTSVSDIVLLLEQIYNGKLVDKQSSGLMLSFLTNQKINDRIPRYLPKGVKVAHKTGLERGVVHDVGIIFSQNGDCLICVFTKRVKDYTTAKKFIGRISLAAYNNLTEE